jgi:hypothetical protein
MPAHLSLLPLMGLLVGPPAAAAPVLVTDDGRVETTVLLPVPVETLRAHLADPRWLPGVVGDGTRASLVGQDGPCQLVDSVSPSAVVEARYRTRHCPTGTGFRSTLVESKHFSEYESEIVLSSEGTATRLRYRLRVVPSFPVPSAIVRSGLKSGVQKLSDALEAWGATQAP